MGVVTRTARKTTRAATRAASKTTRLGWKMAAATVLGAIFGWWWDCPRRVKDAALEHPLEKRAQVSAAVAWPAFALWLAGGAPRCPEWLAGWASRFGAGALPGWVWVVLVSLFATVVLMRRLMATTGHGWPLRSLLRQSRVWVRHHNPLGLALLAGCVLLPVWLATGDRGMDPRWHLAPTATLLAVGAAVTWCEVRLAKWRRDEGNADLASVHRVQMSVIEGASLLPRRGGGYLMPRPPAAVIANLDGAEHRIAMHMPEYEIQQHRDTRGKIVSLSYPPASSEALTRRGLLEATRGLVAALTPAPEPAPWRPDEQVATLTDAVSPTMAARVDAVLEPMGLTIVEWLPAKRIAHAARLGAGPLAARARLADLLGCEPHLIEISATTAHDEKLGRDRLDVVTVHRAPTKGTSREKRVEIWRELTHALPDGSNGWQVQEDPTTGVVTLTYGAPRRLRNLVPSSDLLPASIDTSNWSRLPLGIDPEGREACIDLTAGPHSLIVGPTGSGKSVFLRMHAATALAHGHELILIDAIKDCLDFQAFQPWCVAFADDGIRSARATIEAVYAEGQRRKGLLKKHGAPSWVDLPAEVRRRERIKPLTVLFDEFMSAVMPTAVPKGLPPQDPLVVEVNAINNDKATVLALVGKIARELRFTGIFLGVAMQRPDASLLAGFGEIRSNLTSAVQLVKPGSLPAQETLRMVFPGEQTNTAAETLVELDDGRSLGTALIGADGGEVTGFRVAYAKPSEYTDMLEDLGVPKPERWVIEGRDPEPQTGDIIEPATPANSDVPPDVVSLGEIEVSLDDLAVGEDPFDEFPQPTTPTQPPAGDDEFPDLAPKAPKLESDKEWWE